MKKFLLIGWVCFTAIAFSACTTLRTFSFESLQAADVCFPEQVRSVAVVDYMPLESKVDALGKILEGNGKVAVESLAQGIAATNYFEQVVICDSALRGELSMVDEAPIPERKVDSLLRALDVDLLFAVERVKIQLQKEDLFMPEVMATVPVIDGIVTPLVRVYIAGRQVPLFAVCKTDTICWEVSPELTYGQMIEDASEYAATLPINYLLPHWKEMERYYFDGGSVDMRDAGVYVNEQDWEKASALWQKVYDNKKGKNKMRAAFNLALYYELQGDYVRAQEYLENAVSLTEENSWEAQLIQFYKLQLGELDKRNKLLQLQMKRFESQK